MGLIEDAAASPLGNTDDSSSDVLNADVSLEQIAEALLESAAVEAASTTHVDSRPIRDISEREGTASFGVQGPSGPIEDPQWEDLLQAHQVSNPANDNVVLLANDWRNRRLRFNEDARERSVTAPVYPPPPNAVKC